MPDESVLIGILKWMALALALASTLWGLLAPKPNREEVDGCKRLTTSGAVTLAMILGGVSISGLSLWLETALRKKSEAEAATRAAEADRTQKSIAAGTAVAAANASKGVAELAAARAEGRAQAARSQIAALSRETREILRDARLARQVAAGTSDNLARTGEALTQIERVLQPLEPLTLTVTWEIPGDAPRMKEVTARMAAHAQVVREDWLTKWRAAYRVKPEKPETIRFSKGDELYPDNRAEENFLTGHLAHANIHLALIAAGRSEADLFDRLKQRQSDPGFADLSLQIASDPYRPVDYVIDTGAIRFTGTVTIAPGGMRRSGAITSYPDLQRASAIIWINYMGVLIPPSHPVEVRIRSSSRSYVLTQAEMRRVPMDWPVFKLPPLTPEPIG